MFSKRLYRTFDLLLFLIANHQFNAGQVKNPYILESGYITINVNKGNIFKFNEMKIVEINDGHKEIKLDFDTLLDITKDTGIEVEILIFGFRNSKWYPMTISSRRVEICELANKDKFFIKQLLSKLNTTQYKCPLLKNNYITLESINMNSQLPPYMSFERIKHIVNFYLNDNLDYSGTVYSNVNRELVHKNG